MPEKKRRKRPAPNREERTDKSGLGIVSIESINYIHMVETRRLYLRLREVLTSDDAPTTTKAAVLGMLYHEANTNLVHHKNDVMG